MFEADEFLIRFFKMNKHLQEITSKACKRMKISHVELMIIVLASEKEVNVSQLSIELGITKSAVSQAIVALQIKKLINKVPVPDNKKSFYIKPTQKANELENEILGAHFDKFLQIKEELGEEKFLMFFSLTEEINKIIEKYK